MYPKDLFLFSITFPFFDTPFGHHLQFVVKLTVCLWPCEAETSLWLVQKFSVDLSVGPSVPGQGSHKPQYFSSYSPPLPQLTLQVSS